MTDPNWGISNQNRPAMLELGIVLGSTHELWSPLVFHPVAAEPLWSRWMT